MIAIALASAVPVKGPTRAYLFPEADSCGYWTEQRRLGGGHSQIWEGWILGYISGLNAFGPNDGDVAPDVRPEGLMAWVDNYCAAHPLDRISLAGFKLAEQLRKRRSDQ